MKITNTKLEGCFILEPQIFNDSRGYFYESFNKQKFQDLTGLELNFVQDNESLSTKGVLRGLHYQIGEYAQAKLIRVIKGAVLDVVVDLRKQSPTFGEIITTELSEKNKKQMYVPRGFAHGFVVLSDTAVFSYKCDNFYNKASERGILFSDSNLNIDWKLPHDELIISEKDLALPTLNQVQFN